MKKIISMLLILIMCCSIFAGCGNTEEVVTEGGKLTVGMPQSVQITDYKNNAFTKYIEESLGIELEFVFFSSTPEEYKQQFALMATSKDEFPDVLTGFFRMPANTVNAYGQDGYFLDLTELIDKHGDAYKKALKNSDEKLQKAIKKRITDPDTGAIYALPYAYTPAEDDVQSLMHINQKWLDAVGMKKPTNIAELYDVLKAFKTKDPNGNGQADEIPLFGADVAINYIVNAYMCYEQEHPFNVENGKVYAPFVTEEYREALRFMNKLKEEGLYSELSFTTTSTPEIKNLFTPADGVAKVGIMYGNPEMYTIKTSNVLDEYTALNALGDETGKGGYYIVSEDTVLLSTFITKDCENPELAMKFCDFFYEDETITRARHGEKGVDWNEEPGQNYMGDETATSVINSKAFFEGTSTWGGMRSGILTSRNYNANVDSKDVGLMKTLRLLKEHREYFDKARLGENVVRGLVYNNAEYEVLEQYESTLKNYVYEQTKLFIIGTKNLDTDWDAYVNQIEELNLKGILAQKQSAYDRENK